MQRESYPKDTKYEFSFAPKTFDGEPGVRLPLDVLGALDYAKMCIKFDDEASCRTTTSDTWKLETDLYSYDSTRMRYVLTAEGLLAEP